MIKARISNFFKKHKNKIQDLLTKLTMVAIIVIIATTILSGMKKIEPSKEEDVEIYKPTKTIIKGGNISETQYKTDSNIVSKFLEHCNKKEVSDAYALLSDDCKKELYPTIEYFKKLYYNNIFSEEREYNIQSWISTSEYTVYKIRYTGNILSTGKYKENNIYEDYITLNKGSNTKNISIGKLVYCKDLNIVTNTKEIQAIVTRKKIYTTDEEYEIKIKNNTDKTILLDTLEKSNTLNLVVGSGANYSAYTNKLFLRDLIIDPGKTKNITIKFKKNLSTNNKSEKIEFLNVIKDYYTYKQEPDTYNDIANISLNVEE